MTFTIGALLIKLLITAAVAFIVGLFVGTAWFKRKAAQGFTTVKGAVNADMKKELSEFDETSRKAWVDGKSAIKEKYKEAL